MTLSQMVSVGLILAGFLAAAAITEISLRNIDDVTQERLMKGLSQYRRIHLLGIPLLIITTFFFPVAFWPSLIVYFGIATLLVARKLWELDLPPQLRRWQVASVTTIFVAVLIGGIASWFA